MIGITEKALAEPTLLRLTTYVSTGKMLLRKGCRDMSYQQFADKTNTETGMVIADLASNPRQATPDTMMDMEQMVIEIERMLIRGERETVIVAGTRERVGKLINSWEFTGYNFDIEAVYSPDGIPAHAMQYEMIENEDELFDWGETSMITTAIIDAGYEHAQAITDKLVSIGIRHIWNFSPINLQAPHQIIVENVIPGYPKWHSRPQKTNLN